MCSYHNISILGDWGKVRVLPLGTGINFLADYLFLVFLGTGLKIFKCLILIHMPITEMSRKV